jgi:aldehyde dehydrogenase (NAD(P)+)
MDTEKLDTAINDLQENKDRWVHLPIEKKINLLVQLRGKLAEAAKRWVDLSVEAKGVDPDSPWVGEEWIHGPWALAWNMNALIESLEALAKGDVPRVGRIRSRNNGQLAVRVFPYDFYDWVLLNDLIAEVWMRPGVTEDNLSENMAGFYKNDKPKGKVALVLGAGNVSSIAPLDALFKLYNDGQIVIVKMNPVLDYIGPLFAEVFSPLVEAGYLRIVYGGADVGQYLVHHPGVDTVHLTGSSKTFEAIVYGAGEEGQSRKDRKEPLLKKPISSELGGVSPIILVPGPWTDEDIRYQAENIVTMKLHTAGTLCIAGQVLVTSKRWDGTPKITETVRDLMKTTPARPAFYPGAAERQRAVIAAHPEAELFGGDVPRTLVNGLDPDDEEEYCFREEFFGEVLAQTNLQGDTPSEFLQNAVNFCNQRLTGALGATILIHPKTMKRIGPNLEQALEDLKYGGIGVNLWSAAAYMMARGAWGGYQEDVVSDYHQSGSGFVHNALMFDRPEKSVVFGSFYSFPRSWRHGEFHLAPKPIWYLGNRTGDTTARRVTNFHLDPGLKHLPGIILSAFRG